MATGSPCRIEDYKNYISQTAPVKGSKRRSLRLPLQTRLGDVSKGLPRQTHPLINNTTFHFQAPSPPLSNLPEPNTVWNLVSIRSNIRLCRRGSRQHLHVSRRLSCPPPLQQCGRQHGSGAGTKRRGGGDSVARTYRTEMPFKLSPHRHFDRNHTLCSKIRTKRR